MKSEEGFIHVMGLEFWKAVSQVENPRDPEGRRIPQTERSEASRSFVENNRTRIVPCLFAQFVRGEILANSSPETPGGTSNFSIEAEQTYDDSVFKIELTQYDLDVSNATEKRLNEGDTTSKGNRASQKNRRESFKKNKSAEGWIPPREVIIYFSELCENYPDTIDRYVLPLVENEIQVKY